MNKFLYQCLLNTVSQNKISGIRKHLLYSKLVLFRNFFSGRPSYQGMEYSSGVLILGVDTQIMSSLLQDLIKNIIGEGAISWLLQWLSELIVPILIILLSLIGIGYMFFRSTMWNERGVRTGTSTRLDRLRRWLPIGPSIIDQYRGDQSDRSPTTLESHDGTMDQRYWYKLALNDLEMDSTAFVDLIVNEDSFSLHDVANKESSFQLIIMLVDGSIELWFTGPAYSADSVNVKSERCSYYAHHDIRDLFNNAAEVVKTNPVEYFSSHSSSEFTGYSLVDESPREPIQPITKDTGGIGSSSEPTSTLFERILESLVNLNENSTEQNRLVSISIRPDGDWEQRESLVPDAPLVREIKKITRINLHDRRRTEIEDDSRLYHAQLIELTSQSKSSSVESVLKPMENFGPSTRDMSIEDTSGEFALAKIVENKTDICYQLPRRLLPGCDGQKRSITVYERDLARLLQRRKIKESQ